jgi:tetratricopeptide (TPR) repeat protein
VRTRRGLPPAAAVRPGVLALVLLLLPLGAGAAVPPPLELPTPELTLTATPLALGIARPNLEPPAAPALPAPLVDLAGPPMPRFATAIVKPSPPAHEPGTTVCAFTFGRPGALAECGILRAMHNDLPGAREALESSLEKDKRGPSAPTAYLWLAEVATRQARWEEADRLYRAALLVNPPPDLAAHAALGAGWLALRRGDLAEAQRLLGQALARGATPLAALHARFLDGVARLLAGRPEEALQGFDAVAAGGPPAGMAEELLFWRGIARARLGQTDEALQALDGFLATAAGSHPLRPDALVQSGWVALQRGVADEAVRRFLLAQAANPRGELVSQLRAGLARAYLALGDTTRARDTARLLAADSARDPMLPPVLLQIAEDAIRRQATGEAIDAFRQVLGLQLDPPLAEYVTYRLAEAVERQGSGPEAERLYRVLRETGRVEAIAQRAAFRLGVLALRAQRPGDAQSEGETLLRAGVLPELREAVLLLTAEGAARGNDANRAAALFRVALRGYPASPATAGARLALGWALVKDGEPESALREWEEARLATDINTAIQAHLAIAELALRQGHEDQSLAALQALATLAPAHPLADVLTLNRGVLQLRAKEYERAVQALEPLIPRITVHPDRARLEPLLRRALGLARYHLQQFDLAQQHFERAAYWAPAEPSNWLAVGLAALYGNRPTAAERPLSIARQSPVPEVAVPAMYGLVLVAVRGNDDRVFQERATAFVDRYPAHPYVPGLLYEATRRAVERGDLDRADGWLDRLLKDPAASAYVPGALVMVGEAATRQRPALARKAWTAVLARSQDRPLRTDTWLALAETALAMRDTAEARRALEGYLQEADATDTRAPRALALLIDTQEALNQRPAAIAAARTFLQRFPTDPLAPAIELRLGHHLLVDQQWDEAQGALEAARDTGDPAVAAPAHFYLGELLRSRGDNDGAIAAYLGATYLYPDQTPWAARGLQGAVQGYLARQMPREASTLLKKLLARPGVEPDLTTWARDRLARLGPITGEDPSAVLKKGVAR